MENQRKKIAILAGVLGVMFFVFFMVNQWVDQQIRRLNGSPAAPFPSSRATVDPQPARPQPVKIDPLNDPLAPVARREKSKPDAIPARSMKPKKIYEPALKDPVLIQ